MTSDRKPPNANLENHRRRSIRLRGYDYSQAGAYFVTICTQNREYLFGNIVGGEMISNDAGNMIQIVWDEIPSHYAGTEIDEFVVMPNHIHGIVVIAVGATPCGCPGTTPRGCPVTPPRGCPVTTPRGCPGVIGQARGKGQPRGGASGENGQPRGVAPTVNTVGPLTLGDIVHRFKTMTTKRYADGVHQLNWRSFPGKLWQRNYWEHIVRNEGELNRIREYIHNNPLKWELDRLNEKGRSAGPTMVRESAGTYATEGWIV